MKRVINNLYKSPFNREPMRSYAILQLADGLKRVNSPSATGGFKQIKFQMRSLVRVYAILNFYRRRWEREIMKFSDKTLDY